MQIRRRPIKSDETLHLVATLTVIAEAQTQLLGVELGGGNSEEPLRAAQRHTLIERERERSLQQRLGRAKRSSSRRLRADELDGNDAMVRVSRPRMTARAACPFEHRASEPREFAVARSRWLR